MRKIENVEEIVIRRIKGDEFDHARATRRWENLKAKDLALRFNKPVIAGSDAHLGFEIECVRTVLEDTSNTLEDIKKHIINSKRMLVGKESSYIVHALSFGTQVVKHALRLA